MKLTTRIHQIISIWSCCGMVVQQRKAELLFILCHDILIDKHANLHTNYRQTVKMM
jgi:hypothetical protein